MFWQLDFNTAHDMLCGHGAQTTCCIASRHAKQQLRQCPSLVRPSKIALHVLCYIASFYSIRMEDHTSRKFMPRTPECKKTECNYTHFHENHPNSSQNPQIVAVWVGKSVNALKYCAVILVRHLLFFCDVCVFFFSLSLYRAVPCHADVFSLPCKKFVLSPLRGSPVVQSSVRLDSCKLSGNCKSPGSARQYLCLLLQPLQHLLPTAG